MLSHLLDTKHIYIYNRNQDFLGNCAEIKGLRKVLNVCHQEASMHNVGIGLYGKMASHMVWSCTQIIPKQTSGNGTDN